MDARTLLEKLRRGDGLTPEEAAWFGTNLAGTEISDAQVGAFAMAVCLNGLSLGARVSLTKSMCRSGDVLTWDLPGPILDKHSTGGVGDPVSLALAPALAACGAYVPMISGRGLGHTGGTLDKLEAIPGVVTELNTPKLKKIVKEIGCVIAGASGRIAPADKRLYAVRDVTGTVKSIDLITASILSKKLAAGLDGLVLDVKVGNGAFMTRSQDAKELAQSLVSVSNGAGCSTVALITDMSQPLVNAAGNALEISAVMKFLSCEGKNVRFQEVVYNLGGALLASSELARDLDEGVAMIKQAIIDRRALKTFAKMVTALGGPKNFDVEWRNCMPEAPVQREVKLGKAGVISQIETLKLGECVVSLGGGRRRESDTIDPAVGLADILPIGSAVNPETSVAMLHANSEKSADNFIQGVRDAFVIEDRVSEQNSCIIEVISN